jgi:hypothetical protein
MRFLAAMKLFVKFEEKDLLTRLTGDLHSEEYRKSKLYVPTNPMFAF